MPVEFAQNIEQWMFKDCQRIIVKEGDVQKEVIVHVLCADAIKLTLKA